MVLFESLGTLSHSHSVAAISLWPYLSAVSTQHTNVTDTQPDSARHQELYAASLGRSRAAKTLQHGTTMLHK